MGGCAAEHHRIDKPWNTAQMCHICVTETFRLEWKALKVEDITASRHWEKIPTAQSRPSNHPQSNIWRFWMQPRCLSEGLAPVRWTRCSLRRDCSDRCLDHKWSWSTASSLWAADIFLKYVRTITSSANGDVHENSSYQDWLDFISILV